MTASPPLFLCFRSQQLIVRNAARQNCPAREQAEGGAFTRQEGVLVCTFRLAVTLLIFFAAVKEKNSIPEDAQV